MVYDRAIRATYPAPVAPLGALSGGARSIVERVASGALDGVLGPLRDREVAGAARESVLRAIDDRARALLAEG